MGEGVVGFTFSGDTLAVMDQGESFVGIKGSLCLPAFSFSSLSCPCCDVATLVLFVLLVLELGGFGPLPAWCGIVLYPSVVW